MITLALLHPVKEIPIQNWTFTSGSTIRIGRGVNNDVVLYSAVVSRHHLEVRRSRSSWEVVNLGANGTYIEGKQITKATVSDGMVVRLASSGPKIQIWLDSSNQIVESTLAQQKQELPASDDKVAQATVVDGLTSSKP